MVFVLSNVRLSSRQQVLRVLAICNDVWYLSSSLTSILSKANRENHLSARYLRSETSKVDTIIGYLFHRGYLFKRIVELCCRSYRFPMRIRNRLNRSTTLD
jgi:hypothetical protein